MAKKIYTIEREGQMDFFDNYGIDYENDNSILVDNTDGVYNGNIFEFKLNISDPNKVLFQAIKYLSKLRIKGESVPATILLIDLNDTKVYKYSSQKYRDAIHQVYYGAASKDNSGFVASNPDEIIDYSNMVGSHKVKTYLTNKKTIKELYIPIDINEDCIVGWAERYYREKPTASKGDFLGDDTGVSVKVTGEIRDPKHFKDLITPYTGKTNEKFKYLMDCLNDRLSKKDLGAFYTPELYCKKAAELVQMAVDRVPDGHDYIILDRCAGTGNLEAALIGLRDRNGDELISHCVVSTYEYYEYKVLNERIGSMVRCIIPPTEADVVYENGKVSNADALSEDFINNPLIKSYLDDDNCTIIIFENPPYSDSSAITFSDETDKSKKAKTDKSGKFVVEEFKTIALPTLNEKLGAARESSNLFIWSAYHYYMRQKTDSLIIFSPVKYYKNVGLMKLKMLSGFAFNRKHFHATESVISCCLWANEPSNDKTWDLEVFDIADGKILPLSNALVIKQVSTGISAFNDKRIFTNDTDDGVICNADGTEVIGWDGKKSKHNKNIIAYMASNGLGPDAIKRFLTRSGYKVGVTQSFGFYLRDDNYIEKLPMWVSKLFPQENWYDKDVYNTTADGGDKYTKDKEFLKACLIYTCLSNQNKCLSFVGSDTRYYKNELCFDKGALASVDLTAMTLDAEEQILIDLWNKILAEARATGKCNRDWTYGVYQIDKEINTFHVVGTGKTKKNVYDHPQLNGDLNALRDKLKAYYKSHITAKMFQYELLK